MRAQQMVLANFSHISPAHLLFNGIAMWSFSSTLYYSLGRDQFLGVCATAGEMACVVYVCLCACNCISTFN